MGFVIRNISQEVLPELVPTLSSGTGERKIRSWPATPFPQSSSFFWPRNSPVNGLIASSRISHQPVAVLVASRVEAIFRTDVCSGWQFHVRCWGVISWPKLFLLCHILNIYTPWLGVLKSYQLGDIGWSCRKGTPGRASSAGNLEGALQIVSVF